MNRRNAWRLLLCALLIAWIPGCSDSDDPGNGGSSGNGGNGGDGGDGGGGGGFSVGSSLAASATPDPLVFPDIPFGSSMESAVTIAHTGGSGTLRLADIVLDPESDELELTIPGDLELQPGESVEVMVTFSPLDSSPYEGTLRIGTNMATADVEGVVLEVEITTPGPAGGYVIYPNELQIVGVPLGETKTGQVTVSALGEVILQALSIGDNALGYFSIDDSPEMPHTASGGEQFAIDVAYLAVDGAKHEAELIVELLVDGELVTEVVALVGQGISSGIDVFPNPVDFGWRQADIAHTIPLTLSNEGSADLVVDSIELAAWSDATVSLDNVPGLPLTVAPNDTASMSVVFTPTLDMVQTTGPIAGIVLETNAPDTGADGDANGVIVSGGSVVVNVHGRAEAASLQVTPPDSVDFAFVAQGLSNQRTLTLRNNGSATLNVMSVTVENDPTGEFELVPDEGWGPTSTVPMEGVLLPGEARTVKVTFTNDGAPSGDAFATFRVLSDDGATPDWPVDLVAHRKGSADCDIQLVPSALDFGIVPRGFTKSMVMNLTNVGSGPCSFDSAFVNDCSGWGGFLGTGCGDPAETVKKNGDSEHYSIVTTPPAFQNGLKPGETHEVVVMFTPPDSAPLFGDELVDYAGYLGVRVKDPYPPANGDIVSYPLPQGGGGVSTWPANLHARSGVAELAVFPGELEFSAVTIGCHSQTLEVNACNVGTAPLDLTDAELQGCSPEFQLKAYPGLPSTLEPQQCLVWTVVYVPQDIGDDSCSMGFTTNDGDTPSAVVPLHGSGVIDSEQTDEWIQKTGQDVDVLFVVDDSGSMGEEQSNLSNNFSKFINEASTWQNDYHVGVTTTDIDSTSGKLVGTPRYVTPNNWQQFASNVQVGTSGSGTERGLAAAQMALTLPNVADSTTVCAADSDCTSPEACYDGFCGGPNRGFMRNEAALEVVFVSDEEDQSQADLNFFINFFKNIKGFYNANKFHVHAIVGPPGGCSSSNGDASAGHRYIDVANSTGGNVASICQSDFADALKSIGEIAFGLQTQFFLSRVADPPTIEVKLDDVACSSAGGANWFYDPPSNSVVFVEEGGCMPQAGDHIWIHYETICFLE